MWFVSKTYFLLPRNNPFMIYLWFIVPKLSQLFWHFLIIAQWRYPDAAWEEYFCSKMMLTATGNFSNDICGSDGIGAVVMMCPTCDKYCAFTPLNASCVYSKVYWLVHLVVFLGVMPSAKACCWLLWTLTYKCFPSGMERRNKVILNISKAVYWKRPKLQRKVERR